MEVLVGRVVTRHAADAVDLRRCASEAFRTGLTSASTAHVNCGQQPGIGSNGGTLPSACGRHVVSESALGARAHLAEAQDVSLGCMPATLASSKRRAKRLNQADAQASASSLAASGACGRSTTNPLCRRLFAASATQESDALVVAATSQATGSNESESFSSSAYTRSRVTGPPTCSSRKSSRASGMTSSSSSSTQSALDAILCFCGWTARDAFHRVVSYYTTEVTRCELGVVRRRGNEQRAGKPETRSGCHITGETHTSKAE